MATAKREAVNDLEALLDDLEDVIDRLQKTFDLPTATEVSLKNALSSLEYAYAVLDDLSLD